MNETKETTTTQNCYKLEKVLVSAHVEAEFENLFRYRWRKLTEEEKAKELEDACKEFASFIRDHRSQDPVILSVIRETKDLCSVCKSQWETVEENGMELCAYCGSVYKIIEAKP